MRALFLSSVPTCDVTHSCQLTEYHHIPIVKVFTKSLGETKVKSYSVKPKPFQFNLHVGGRPCLEYIKGSQLAKI